MANENDRYHDSYSGDTLVRESELAQHLNLLMSRGFLPDLSPGNKVMQIGSGNGTESGVLKQHFPGIHLTAIDRDPRAQQIALTGSKVDTFLLGDVVTMPESELTETLGQADLVLALRTPFPVVDRLRGLSGQTSGAIIVSMTAPPEQELRGIKTLRQQGYQRTPLIEQRGLYEVAFRLR